MDVTMSDPRIELRRAVQELVHTPADEFDLPAVLTKLLDLAAYSTHACGAFLKRVSATRLSPDIVAASADGSLAIEGAVASHGIPVNCEGQQLGVLVLLRDLTQAEFSAEDLEYGEEVADLLALALRRARDTEELNRSREAVHAALDAKYRLVGGVSINLKETLSTASGYLQLLELQDELTLAQQDYMGRGRRAIGSAVTLINELVELSRADAGDLKVELETVNVNAFVRDAARNHSLVGDSKQILITTELCAASPLIQSDSDYLRQILDALLSNAVKYTPERGCVTLRVELREGRRTNDPDRWTCVTVHDNGPGIPDAEDLFEEVKRVAHRKVRLGFRLVICRRIARLLGGDLTLESSSRGASFTLWLPKWERAASASLPA